MKIKREKQKDIVLTYGDLWRFGWARMKVYSQPDKLVVYEGKKKIGELKYNIC